MTATKTEKVSRPEYREKQWTANGMQQIIDTAHKTFNRQTSAICRGNQIGDTVTSFFIRPYTETECNGHKREPGHLQNFDLGYFKNLPNHVRNFILKNGRDRFLILYKLFHSYKPSGHWQYIQLIHGYVITDYDYNHVQTFQINPGVKSFSVLDTAKDFICRFHYADKLSRREGK